MSLLQETKKVFDTKLYKKENTPVHVEKVAEDLAGMVIEAADAPLEERINPRKLKIVDGIVIDPLDGKPVLESANTDTELSTKETEGTKKFYDSLIKGVPGILVVQVSPPGGISPYIEARINVGLKINSQDIEFYGIPSHLSPEGCLNWAVHLTEFSDFTILTEDPDDLRAMAVPINVPEGINPWIFLSKFAPLDSPAWKKIYERNPWKVKNEALKDSTEMAEKISPMIEKAETEREYIVAGAIGERGMESRGWVMNALACVGMFNSDILNGFSVDSFGGIRKIGEMKLIKNCGNCKASLNMYMKSGDKCPHCNGVYKGC